MSAPHFVQDVFRLGARCWLRRLSKSPWTSSTVRVNSKALALHSMTQRLEASSTGTK